MNVSRSRYLYEFAFVFLYAFKHSYPDVIVEWTRFFEFSNRAAAAGLCHAPGNSDYECAPLSAADVG